MRRCASIFTGLLILMATAAWAQTEERVPPATTPFAVPGNGPDPDADRMTVPPPVSGLALPVVLGSQERSNYLRGGVAFMSAYTDNALQGAGGQPLSDISYSVAPFVSMDQTTTREHLVLTYAPGYTFYQRFSNMNLGDQNASVRFAYRLSPHLTFSAGDVFQKTSSVFNQPYSDTTGTVNTGPALPNFSIIAPIASELNNVGNVGLAYQFALNDMAGANGTFTNLHYPNPSQVPGLFDSSSQAGLAFWAHRLSRRQYIGATYQYQRLLAYPTQGVIETQTHAPLLFYSAYPAKDITLSLFGGPQYSETAEPSMQASLKQWTPAGGASLRWQGHLTSVALSYVHIISGSAGLAAPVKLDSGTASVSQQIMKTLTASVSGGYAQNDAVGNISPSLETLNGHSVLGTASMQKQFGRNVNLLLGYTRVHQDYPDVPVLASTPNTNREFISVSYHFDRALGR